MYVSVCVSVCNLWSGLFPFSALWITYATRQICFVTPLKSPTILIKFWTKNELKFLKANNLKANNLSVILCTYASMQTNKHACYDAGARAFFHMLFVQISLLNRCLVILIEYFLLQHTDIHSGMREGGLSRSKERASANREGLERRDECNKNVIAEGGIGEGLGVEVISRSARGTVSLKTRHGSGVRLWGGGARQVKFAGQ